MTCKLWKEAAYESMRRRKIIWFEREGYGRIKPNPFVNFLLKYCESAIDIDLDRFEINDQLLIQIGKHYGEKLQGNIENFFIVESFQESMFLVMKLVMLESSN